MLPIGITATISLALLALGTPAQSQSLTITATTSDSTHIDVNIGEVIDIEILADLSGYAASGISLYVRLPAGSLAIVDQGDHLGDGIRPWLPGALFAGAVETENCLAAGRDAGFAHDQQLLAYSLILGPGKNRNRSGKGVVGRFQFISIEPIDHGRIEIFSNPVYDSFLVLDAGMTERHFRGVQNLEVSSFWSTLVPTRDSWGTIKTRHTQD